MLLAALFCLGTHSTVFGPIKYALLPQHLRDDELVAGNALIEAGTFLAILLGTILGGSIVLVDSGALVVGGVGIGVGGRSAWLASRLIPPAPPALGGDRRGRACSTTRSAVLRHATARAELLLPILALSWFWLFGATVVSGLPVFAKDVLFADEHVVTLMLALFAVGVGLGSVLAERLLHGEVSARFVPVAALRDGGLRGRPALGERRPRAGARASLGRRASSRMPGSLRVLADLVGLAIAGGLFTVPLYARAAARERAEPPRPRHRREQHHQRAGHERRRASRRRCSWPRGLTMGELFALCGIAHRAGRARGGVGAARAAGQERAADGAAPALSRRGRRPRARARRACRTPSSPPTTRRSSTALLLGAFLPGDPIFAVDTLIATRGGRARSWRSSTRCRWIPTNPLSIRAHDPRRRRRVGLRHLPRRPHHDDRLADEGLRGAGHHRRAHRRGAAPGPHRRRGVHAVLAPRRQGAPAPVPARPHHRAAAAPATCRPRA